MERRSPLFSVITVVLNGEKALEQTILSVVNQTYRDFEYLVIDGGSTDRTLELIGEYQKHISSCVSEPDEGIHDAMNKAIRKSRGRYLFFLNCGDRFANAQVLEVVAKCLETDSPDILYGAVTVNGEEGSRLIRVKIQEEYDLYRETICHQAMFASSQVFKTVGEFSGSYKMTFDREWLLRALKTYGFDLTYIDVPISIYDPSGITSRRGIVVRWQNMKINYLYFRRRFLSYLLRRVADKLKCMFREASR